MWGQQPELWMHWYKVGARSHLPASVRLPSFAFVHGCTDGCSLQLTLLTHDSDSATLIGRFSCAAAARTRLMSAGETTGTAVASKNLPPPIIVAPAALCIRACVRDRLPPNYTAVRVKRSGFRLHPPFFFFLADWKQIRAQNPQVAGQTEQVSVRVSSREAQTSSRATMMEAAAPREERGERRVTMTRILLLLLPSHTHQQFCFSLATFFLLIYLYFVYLFIYFPTFFWDQGVKISCTHTRTRVKMASFVA